MLRSCLVALVTLLVAAPTASAAVEANTTGGKLGVRPDAAPRATGMSVSLSALPGGSVRIESAEGVTTTSCFVESTTSVTCAVAAGAEVSGTGMADTITITGTVPGTATGGYNVYVDAGDGADNLTGGAGREWFVSRGGNDTLRPGAGADRMDGGTGNDDVDGGDGADLVTNGYDDSSARTANDGADTYVDTGASGTDQLDYGGTPGLPDVAPVTLTVDNGAADDGSAGEGDRVGAGFEEVRGTSLDDVITGSAADETIDGYAGNDALAGGAGADSLFGHAGLDNLFSDDGVADKALECDEAPPAEQSVGEKAVVDSVDPAPARCEEVETKGATPGGGGTAPTPVSTQATFTVPDALPRKANSGKYKFKDLEALQKAIKKAGARIDLSRKRLKFAQLPDQFRRDADDQDIVKLSAKPGAKLKYSLVGATAPVLTVGYYDERLDLLANVNRKCPYRDRRTKDFRQALIDSSVDTAIADLVKRRCKWRIVQTFKSDRVTEETVSSANVADSRKGRTRTYYYALTVERPRNQRDFALAIGARPQVEIAANPGDAAELANEPTLDAQSRLPVTSGRQASTINVGIRNVPSGRAFRDVEVELFDTNGTRLASQRSAANGGATLTAQFKRAGRARVVARIVDTRGRIAEGYVEIPVADLGDAFFTLDGRYLKKSGGTYRKATPPPPPAPVVAIEEAMEAAVEGTGRSGGALGAASGIYNGTGGSSADRIAAAKAQTGLEPVKVSINGTLDPSFNLTPTRTGLAALVVQPDGSFASAKATALAVPTQKDSGLASLVGPDGATLIGADGATLVGNNGNTLNANRSELLRRGPLGLIGNDAGSFLPPGTTFITDQGAGVVSTGGNGFIPVSPLGG